MLKTRFAVSCSTLTRIIVSLTITTTKCNWSRASRTNMYIFTAIFAVAFVAWFAMKNPFFDEDWKIK
uniref:Uncharacterized protein n=1 Tax=Trichogramma kaykai TaxID=54128 RepID=A0ABD2WTG2_9HYME